MTKDWDSVQGIIHELSVVQKKSLEEVKSIMESTYRFKASTRAYRMKLKEWGYMRHKARKLRLTPSGSSQDGTGDETDDSFSRCGDRRGYSPCFPLTPSPDTWQHTPRLMHLPWPESWTRGGNPTHSILMDMLAAICDRNCAELDQLCRVHPEVINHPIGLPFDVGNYFFDHPVLQTSILSQHMEQTLLDVAAGFPSTEVVCVLLTHGAYGSNHPMGENSALYNAIKNSRARTVSALIDTGRCSIDAYSCEPLMQAVVYDVPEVVRILIEKGADVNLIPDTPPFQTPLQTALERRAADWSNPQTRQRSSEIIKLLLDAGASIHDVSTPSNSHLQALTPFQTFLKPWENDPLWMNKLNATELEIFHLFVARGADLHTPSPISPYGNAPPRIGYTAASEYQNTLSMVSPVSMAGSVSPGLSVSPHLSPRARW
ncbi:ankyrin [Delitschia confertaspora ATCC 74209]|uniref:Ankyrin n=1 Tax=Delitschia confertaspora ATCC 74209 TaxID=1513339 RepID=A0A9P4JLP1_9PLEO|nr:ankyrin [Delitschia confertaspora ATCC 74209]